MVYELEINPYAIQRCINSKGKKKKKKGKTPQQKQWAAPWEKQKENKVGIGKKKDRQPLDRQTSASHYPPYSPADPAYLGAEAYERGILPNRPTFCIGRVLVGGRWGVNLVVEWSQ